MSKRPLVIYYTENKDVNGERVRTGKIFYIKKKRKFISEMEGFFEEIKDNKRNEDFFEFRNTVKTLIEKRSKNINKYFLIGKKGIHRDLNFDPEYRAIIKNVEFGGGGEIIVKNNIRHDPLLERGGNRIIIVPRYAQRIYRGLTLKERELIRKVKAGETTVEKNVDGEFIELDYNTNNPFATVFLRDEDGNTRYDQELSKKWKEKLSGVRIIKRIATHEAPKNDPYQMVEDYNSKIRSEGLKLMEKKLVSFDEEGYKRYADFWTHQVYIHGVVDFNDYPNQNITVFQALNIDWDLLLTFNICIKDLEPQSFQFITDYSDKGTSGNVKFEGPINCDFILNKKAGETIVEEPELPELAVKKKWYQLYGMDIFTYCFAGFFIFMAIILVVGIILF